MPAKIDLSERLFNLTCALLVSSQGLTKAEIFANVQGYKERYVQGGDNESLSRLFERDKVLLTKVGVAWRSFIPPEDMDDNQEYRYLIANEDFVLPRRFGQKHHFPEMRTMRSCALGRWENQLMPRALLE